MKDLNDTERAQILRTIEENKKGEYWNILSGFIRVLLEEENKVMSSLTRNGIKKENVDEYNLCLERRCMYERFLSINEELIESHLSVIQRAQRLARHLANRVHSFVGLKNLAGDGHK